MSSTGGWPVWGRLERGGSRWWLDAALDATGATVADGDAEREGDTDSETAAVGVVAGGVTEVAVAGTGATGTPQGNNPGAGNGANGLSGGNGAGKKKH